MPRQRLEPVADPPATRRIPRLRRLQLCLLRYPSYALGTDNELQAVIWVCSVEPSRRLGRNAASAT
uniref:Uncharacterized protein n=1 Tax=Escherichia coli TaxID=562 RepID=A0A3S9LU13_ECOLX|nr:hypothetical protein [Escherichia coli]